MRSKIYSLLEFNQVLRRTLESEYPDRYLITAEIASLKVDQKGHCYLDLVERDERSVVAQIRATIWTYQFRGISKRFKTATGMELSKGLKVMIEAGLSFHERYGISLNVTDIDPSYTLGEMALKRREILLRLEKEGLLEKNRLLEIPLVPLNIAVISSPGAAGYEDFVRHLKDNPYSYPFAISLYSAVMQGDSAESSIVSAIHKCSEKQDDLDLIVIIRGGGGVADLHCFDSYEIGKAIAGLRVPVISGIGHERDRTVVDEVAHTSVKTPTAAASLLIETVREFDIRISEMESRLVRAHRSLIDDHLAILYRYTRDIEKETTRYLVQEEERMGSLEGSLGYTKKMIINLSGKLDSLMRSISVSIRHKTREQRRILVHTYTILKTHVRSFMSMRESILRDRNSTIRHLDPVSVLKRGYTLTYKNGSLLKDIRGIFEGDKIRTVLHEGTVTSSVEEVRSNGKEAGPDV